MVLSPSQTQVLLILGGLAQISTLSRKLSLMNPAPAAFSPPDNSFGDVIIFGHPIIIALLPSLISSWLGSTCLSRYALLEVRSVPVMPSIVHLVAAQWPEILSVVEFHFFKYYNSRYYNSSGVRMLVTRQRL